MDSNDAVAMLDEAVRVAREAGRECTGWTLQSLQLGYASWIYRDDEDGDGQFSIFDEVEVLPSAAASARWCLEMARDLT